MVVHWGYPSLERKPCQSASQLGRRAAGARRRYSRSCRRDTRRTARTSRPRVRLRARARAHGRRVQAQSAN